MFLSYFENSHAKNGYLTSCLLNLTQLKRSIKEGSEWVPIVIGHMLLQFFSCFLGYAQLQPGQLHKSIIVVVFVLINCIAPPACHFFLSFFSISLTKLHQKSWAACRSSKYHRGVWPDMKKFVKSPRPLHQLAIPGLLSVMK